MRGIGGHRMSTSGPTMTGGISIKGLGQDKQLVRISTAMLSTPRCCSTASLGGSRGPCGQPLPCSLFAVCMDQKKGRALGDPGTRPSVHDMHIGASPQCLEPSASSGFIPQARWQGG